MSKARLAGEPGKIRTGAQTSLRFRRLPVRPPVRSCPTDTRPVAEPSGQNKGSSVATGLSGPAIHVSDRVVDCHRETSPLRATSHEAHTVASQKQLEGTRIFRKGDSGPQDLTSPFTMVATGGKRPYRPTTTPYKTCSANLYRRIKRRVGRSLKRAHCQRFLVGSGKQTAHKLFGTKSSISSPKEFQDICAGQIVLVATDNTTVVSYINKEGGMRSGPLCALLWRILTWCTRRQVTLKARHIPGQLNVIADKLSRLGQIVQTEWSLLPEVFQTVCHKWHRPQIDLFATRFNHKLPRFVSPVPDPMAVAVDALTLPWEDLDAYAFPPTAILGKVV